MRKTLTAAQPMRYGTRMLKAGEPFEADGPMSRTLLALGRAELHAKQAKAPKLDPLDHDKNGRKGGSPKPAGDDLAELRAEYQTAVGKRPFHGWDAATLRERISEAKRGDS